jgi:Cys-tRNA(Pro)/Cys-tRNA(Cys) deacylase
LSAKTKTNAMRILDISHIEYAVREYPINESDLSATYVARAIGIPAEQAVKTIVVKGEKTGIFVCLLQGHREIDFKKLMLYIPDRSIEAVNQNRLLSLTGYVRGGVSPIGMTKRYLMFLDEKVLVEEWISCSAGKRGLQLWLRSSDLKALTSARVICLSKPISTSTGESSTD